MFRRSACATVAVIGGLLVTTTSASPVAAGAPRTQTGALCTIESEIILSSGVGLMPPTGPAAFTSGPRPGSITCRGLVNGRTPSGPGTFRMDGVFGVGPGGGDTCLFGAGYGTYSITIPTAGGPVTVAEPFTFYGGAAGPMTAPSLSGSFEIVPAAGADCLGTPVTGGAFFAQGALTGR
jgi:hypothetical protein